MKWLMLYVIVAVIVAGVICLALIAAVTFLAWTTISMIYDQVKLSERRKLLR